MNIKKKYALISVFDKTDLMNLQKYNIVIKLMINGISDHPFSAQTLPPPSLQLSCHEKDKNLNKIVTQSRLRYSEKKEVVEKKLNNSFC